MKKIIVFLSLISILVPVLAEEDYIKDDLSIEKLETNIVVLSDSAFRVTDNITTKLIYGDLPDTQYFNKRLYNTYSYNYGSKYEYKVTNEIIDIESDSSYSYNEQDEYLEINFGDRYDLLKEETRSTITYDAVFDKGSNNSSFYISNYLYRVKQIDFTIVSNVELTNKDIEFSLDGKTFSNKIDGLEYDVENSMMVRGTYNKELKEGNQLLFRIKKASIEINNTVIIVLISISLIVLFTTLYVKLIKPRLKK